MKRATTPDCERCFAADGQWSIQLERYVCETCYRATNAERQAARDRADRVARLAAAMTA